MRRLFYSLFVMIALAAKVRATSDLDGIVLFVSDGTSQELITATRIYLHGVEGKLAMEALPHAAIVRTYSASHLVTDSGAAATALARGIKADNRVVGQAGPTDKGGPASILDLAKAAGWSTGVVTDDSVTGATVAAFLVEHGQRDDEAAIAAKMIPQFGRRVDVVLGGGGQWFSGRAQDPNVSYPEGARAVVQETREMLASSEVAVFDQWDDLVKMADTGKEHRPVLGTFSPKEFSYFADGKRHLRLVNLVEQAVRILRGRGRPFLLVVEAALPDKASHLNNAKRAIIEVGEMDAAISWLQTHTSEQTLLLVTTDHNTGGLTLNGYPPSKYRGDTLLRPDALTGRSWLTWASGPGVDREKANVRIRVVEDGRQPPREVHETRQPGDPDYVEPAAIEPSKAALHTGGDVWLLAGGPGSEKVHGFMDNTEIFRLMADVIKDAPKR